MGADRSAFDVLELLPGATRAQIDEAYRRLIKQHHPDRPGGDTRRAEEIIRAYRTLRPHQPLPEVMELRDRPGEGAIGWRWQVVALGLAIALLLLATFSGSLDASFNSRFARIDLPAPLGRVIAIGGEKAIERPVDGAAIDRVIDEVHATFDSRSEEELAAASRNCHLEFRRNVDVDLLDRCVAFDDTVIALQNRDPMRDRGPFNDVVITRRHWSEAAKLSNDNVAIDGRLDRIRLRVELRLAEKGQAIAETDDAMMNGPTDSAENVAADEVVIPDEPPVEIDR